MKKPRNYLWLIPVQLVIDVIAFFVGLKIDEANYTPAPNGSFMFPAVTFMFIFIFGAITILVALIAIILTAVSRKRYIKRMEKLARENAD